MRAMGHGWMASQESVHFVNVPSVFAGLQLTGRGMAPRDSTGDPSGSTILYVSQIHACCLFEC